MRQLNFKYHSEERGVAVMEFAIVIPLFLFLVIGGLEYAKQLERKQWASQLSREVASMSYRSCGGLRGVDMSLCVEKWVLDPIKKTASALAPGTEFVVALYTYDSTRPVRVREEAVAGSNKYLTNFRNSGFLESRLNWESANRVPNTVGLSLRENEMIVVASAYIPFDQSFARVIPGLNLLLPSVVQAVTIILF